MIHNIDMTGFAAVMLALVAMFAIPAAVVVDGRRGARYRAVDLPYGYHVAVEREAIREDALFIAVERDGAIWLDDERVQPAQIADHIRKRVNEGARRKVYLKVDQRARYGRVEAVLDGVRTAGIEDLAFIANEKTLRAR